jgi:hypothetical protein
MNRTWFEQNPALLQEVRSAIAADQPDLHETIIDGAVRLRGSYAVRDGGTVLDRYQIEIRFPFDYPMHLPAVEEIGRRLPRIADRHINNDGTACLLVPEEWLIAGDQSFKTFLHGPLKNFFLGQLLVEVGKPWPSRERPHGYEGLVQAYMELLGITDPSQVVAYFDCLRKKTIKGHYDCPCGSNRRLRCCHRAKLQELAKRIPPQIAQKAYDGLISSSPHRQ